MYLYSNCTCRNQQQYVHRDVKKFWRKWNMEGYALIFVINNNMLCWKWAPIVGGCFIQYACINNSSQIYYTNSMLIQYVCINNSSQIYYTNSMFMLLLRMFCCLSTNSLSAVSNSTIEIHWKHRDCGQINSIDQEGFSWIKYNSTAEDEMSLIYCF